MKNLPSFLLLSLLLAVQAVASDGIRKEAVKFAAGKSSASLHGQIRGDQTVDYQLVARAGQAMTVDFQPSNASAYYNVLPPGSEEAIFIGSTEGNHFEGKLPADGAYTIRVFLMRSAARRNETAKYELKVSILGGAAAAPAAPAAAANLGSPSGTAGSGPFDQTLGLLGVTFHVTCPNEGSLNTVRIVPSGLEKDNAPLEKEVDGLVTGAEVADLDVDGSPELYVYVQSAGSGSYGSLLAYAANRKKSLSEIFLPPVAEDPKLSKGYMGHDAMAAVESTFLQRFPLYGEGDTNAKPTGKTRQLQYKLVGGEAGWKLKLDKVVEY